MHTMQTNDDLIYFQQIEGLQKVKLTVPVNCTASLFVCLVQFFVFLSLLCRLSLFSLVPSIVCLSTSCPGADSNFPPWKWPQKRIEITPPPYPLHASSSSSPPVLRAQYHLDHAAYHTCYFRWLRPIPASFSGRPTVSACALRPPGVEHTLIASWICDAK